jgi:AAA domain
MEALFHRTALGTELAARLLRPGVLDEQLRSGLFLSGLRRTGKTTFLRNDLIPALEEAGAVVIYVDLWSDPTANPAGLVNRAVVKALKELQTPKSKIRQKLKKIGKADVAAFGFSFALTIDHVGTDQGPTLAEALTEVVDHAKADVVLIVDEVQHAITTEDGERMLLALKSARDAINPRPNTPGHFIFVGTGSHRAHVRELSTRRNQAFTGATSQDYPVLGRDYVEYLLRRLSEEAIKNPLPSVDAVIEAFETLGHRPEQLLHALSLLNNQLPEGGEPDSYLTVIAATLRSSAVDDELRKVEQVGPIGLAIFRFVASANGDTKGVYGSEAQSEYDHALGRRVRPEEIQQAVNELLASNIIMRSGHGVYGITDQFLKTVWRERNNVPPETFS